MPQIFFYGLTALATPMRLARRRLPRRPTPVLNNVIVIGAARTSRIASEPPTVTSVLDDPALVVLLAGRRPGSWRWRSSCSGAQPPGQVSLGRWRHPAVRSSPASRAGPSGTSRRTGWRSGSRCSCVRHRAARRSTRRVHLLPAAARSVHGLDHDGARPAASSASRGDYGRAAPAVRHRFRSHDARRPPAAPAVLSRPIVARCSTAGASPRRTVRRPRETLLAFSLGLFSFSAYLFTLRSFTRCGTRTPFLLNCLENGLNIVLAVVAPGVRCRGLACASIVHRGDGRSANRDAPRRLDQLEAATGRRSCGSGRFDRARRSRGPSPGHRLRHARPAIIGHRCGAGGRGAASSSPSTCSGSASCASSVTLRHSVPVVDGWPGPEAAV